MEFRHDYNIKMNTMYDIGSGFIVQITMYKYVCVYRIGLLVCTVMEENKSNHYHVNMFMLMHTRG